MNVLPLMGITVRKTRNPLVLECSGGANPARGGRVSDNAASPPGW